MGYEKISIAFLDTTSFPITSEKILRKLLWIKLVNNDTSDVTIYFNDIVRTTVHRYKSIQMQAKKNDKMKRLYNLIHSYNRKNAEMSILLDGFLMVEKIASEFGFVLSPSDTAIIDQSIVDKSEIYHFQNNYKTLLYTKGDFKTTMRYSVFKLVKSNLVQIPECVNDIQPDETDIDASDSMFYSNAKTVNAIHNEIVNRINTSEDPRFIGIIDLIPNKTSHEVIDILINLSLPMDHPDKIVKFLLIFAPERSGKSAWREIMQLIVNTFEFGTYVKQHKQNYKAHCIHLVCAPNVRVPTEDAHLKSKQFMSKIRPKGSCIQMLPSKSKLNNDEFMTENIDVPYVCGKSEKHIDKLIQIQQYGASKNVYFVNVFDEADDQFSMCLSGSQYSKFENIIRTNYIGEKALNPNQCGIVFQSATMMPLLLTDPINRVLYGFTEVFNIGKSVDYSNDYDLAFPMERMEKYYDEKINKRTGEIKRTLKEKVIDYKLSLTGNSPMHQCINEYLHTDFSGEDFFNRPKKQRAFPVCLCMPTSQVNHADYGFDAMAKNLSLGNFTHIKSHNGMKPVTISFSGSGFKIYNDGKNIAQKIKKTKNNMDILQAGNIATMQQLQEMSKSVATHFQFERHIVVFGYNVITRGVTNQFTAEQIIICPIEEDDHEDDDLLTDSDSGIDSDLELDSSDADSDLESTTDYMSDNDDAAASNESEYDEFEYEYEFEYERENEANTGFSGM